jgi:hypothetical protein
LVGQKPKFFQPVGSSTIMIDTWLIQSYCCTGSLTLASISAIKGRCGQPDRKIVILRSTKAALAFNCRDYDLASEWYDCKNFVAQSRELCGTHSWVVSSSPGAEDIVMGKVVEVLRRTDSMEGLLILEQYMIQPERHEVFNMPVLAPKRREEAVFLLNPKVSYSGFNFFLSQFQPRLVNDVGHPIRFQYTA